MSKFDNEEKEILEAFSEGIPCQTLVASVLHIYFDGQLVEKNR